MFDYPQGPVRVLIVDDHALFRESLARLLAAEPNLQIIGHCASAEDATTMIKDRPVDLLLLDFDLGVSNCTEFVRSTVAGGFEGKILLVTAGVGASQAAELVRLGVVGIFLKHDLPMLLTEAIRDIAGGKVWLDQKILQSTVSGSSWANRAPAALTVRERQVLSQIFEGLTNKEIALRLATSEGSVKATIQQLFSKCGVRTRSQLVRVALEQYKGQP
jgi:two-component system, NarL family, nitrate/nitrite response regulator NarL